MSPRDMIEYMRNRRTILRCAGLCIKCGKKKTPIGKARCDQCESSKDKSAAIYALTAEQDSNNLAKLGICTRCKAKAATPGKKICFDCQEKSRLARVKNQQLKEEKRRSQGLCIKCGKRKVVAGRKYCTTCEEITIWRPERIKARVAYPIIRQYLEQGTDVETELHILIDMRDIFAERFNEYTSDIAANKIVVDSGKDMLKKLCKGVQRLIVISQWIRNEKDREASAADLLLLLQENAKKRRDSLYMARLVSSYGSGMQG